MFEVPAESYGRFMGRYSEPLADQFVSWVDARPGQRALDVGCGPGALTARLAGRLGGSAVSAVDPSESFVAAVRQRLPEVDVRESAAEDLPYEAGEFDLCLAQLVVHFMADPVKGLQEMARVTKPGGRIAASVWDHGGRSGPLSQFWGAVSQIDPDAHGEADLAGAREGHLVELCAQAGLVEVESARLTVTVPYAAFDEWWEPYTLGVGPAGAYVARLDESGREALRQRCKQVLPTAPFEISASAWCIQARV